MTTVVYTENRRLEIQISKLVEAGQSVPEEVEHRRETIKWLEQNQTVIMTKFVELEKRISDIDHEFQIVRDDVKKAHDETSDHERVQILQENIAGFGAQMKDVSMELNTLKEHVQDMKKQETETKDSLEKLDSYVHSANGTGNASNILQVNNATILEIVHNLTHTYDDQLHSLSTQLVNVNDTLSQRTNHLNDDVLEHKTKLDTLIENYANMTSHVISVENDLIELKKTVPKIVSNPIENGSSEPIVSANNTFNSNNQTQPSPNSTSLR